jgi:erythronate-4-phosphate dehydrogenase
VWQPALPEIKDPVIDFPESGSLEQSLHVLISKVYDIRKDDHKLRQIGIYDKNEAGGYFDSLRKNYPVRREFSNFTVSINKKLQQEIKILKSLRFKLREY